MRGLVLLILVLVVLASTSSIVNKKGMTIEMLCTTQADSIKCHNMRKEKNLMTIEGYHIQSLNNGIIIQHNTQLCCCWWLCLTSQHMITNFSNKTYKKDTHKLIIVLVYDVPEFC